MARDDPSPPQTPLDPWTPPRAPDGADADFARAADLHRQGRLGEADALYRAVLAKNPRHVDAVHMLGVMQIQVGRYPHALALIDQALAIRPDYADALYNRGIALRALNRVADALASFDRALSINPGHAEGFYNRGNVLADLGRFNEAELSFAHAAQIRPGFPEACNNRGNMLRALGRHAEALAEYDRALGYNPAFLEALNNRAAALLDLKRADEALATVERALAARPDYAHALYNRGLILSALGRHDQALSSYNHMLALQPDFVEAHFNRGLALSEMGRADEALAAFDKTLALKPDHAAAFHGRGNVLSSLRQLNEALSSYDRALSLRPGFAEALNNRGLVLLDLGRVQDAFASFDKAVQAKPDFAEGLSNRGTALLDLDRHDEAAASFAALVALAPDFPYALGNLFLAKRFCCDWGDYDATSERILAAVGRGEKADTPLAFLSHSADPALAIRAAQIYDADRTAQPLTIASFSPRAARDAIRVAYISGEFSPHPVSQLLVQIFERHDKARFETFAVSFGPDMEDPFTTRLKSAFTHFLKVPEKSDAGIAAMLRDRQIDIAVDLMGFAGKSRPGIFAHRAAPVQVNFLGFPGTMGAAPWDYLIADRHVVPDDTRRFYAEKIAFLPDSFMPADNSRVIGRTPTKAQAGLPEQGLVFAAFHASYKFSPALFAAWMRVLRETQDSVLWLPHADQSAMSNLKHRAESLGVAPRRLIFAPYIKTQEDHLARLALADLFLDTFPYNAHSTAVDALWAGVPLLTVAGESFASRIAMSLLHAVDLPELVTSTLAEYETRALELASDAQALARLKSRLAFNRVASPLFDTALYCRRLEAAFAAMHARQVHGEPPATFTV